MHTGNFDEILDQILSKDPRYTREAYLFVREALDYTQKMMAKSAREPREGREPREPREAKEGKEGKEGKEEAIRHVSGQELLEGVRALALEQFGPMTITVLAEWGVKRCEDFGEIVFNMVDKNLLAKTKDDTRADFAGGYNFVEAFQDPFVPPSRRHPSTTQSEPRSTKA